jgi:hypothetical protein
MYEIPQQLEYKEKIIFGLTFSQLIYAFIFFPIAFSLFFRLNASVYVRAFLTLIPVLLAAGFMFFDFTNKIKDWVGWYKLRSLKEFKIKNFFDIEIDNNLIHTKKKKLAVLKVEPVNFDIKPKKEQETITFAFQKLLNSLDFPIQILMTTENLSLGVYLKSLEQRIKGEKSKKIFKEYKGHMKDLINKNSVLNRNFYIIIPETTDINIQLKICEDRLHSLNLKTKRLNDIRLRRLFRQIFNNQKDCCLPEEIKNEPDHIEINNKLSRTIYAHGYPRIVESGFLDRIVSSLGDFNLSLHIEPCPLETTMIILNKELQKQRADLYAAKLKNQLNPSLEIKYKDTLKTLENLQKGNEKLFNISLYVTCKADSLGELNLLTKKVESELNSLLIIPKQSKFRMLQGFKSCLPLTENTLKIKRNITTHGLSAFFPFTSSFFKFDETGVWFGLNKNKIPIIRDIFKLSNANGICLATSGAGKSYLAKLFISRHLLNGTKVIIVDPQGEYRDLVKRFNGQVIDLSRESETIINPLDLMGHDYPEKRLSLMDLIPIMLGDITDPQKAFLDKALTESYEKKGIYMDDDDSDTWNNEPPIMEDLLESINEIEKTATIQEKTIIRSLISRIDMYVHGVFSFLNKNTNIDFNSNLICFDLGNMPKQVKPAMMFLILDYVYSKMKEDMNRKLLVVDEAWSLLSRTKESSYIFEIVKTCRKFNLGLLLINQEVEDMLNSKAGKSVLANSSYTLLLKQKPSVINNIQKTFNLSDSERLSLLTAMVGEGILIMENEHSKIKIVASEKEHDLITTNADELLKNHRDRKKVMKRYYNPDRKKVNVKVDPRARFFKKEELSKEDIHYLKKKRYIEFDGHSITSKKKEKYMVKPRYNESPQHCFLTYDLTNYLKGIKQIKNVRTPETKKPDIIFKIKNKEYGIEVETGKMLKTNKEALKEKIEKNNREYSKRWFFLVTAKKLGARYNKLAKTHDKRTIKQAIKKLVKKA